MNHIALVYRDGPQAEITLCVCVRVCMCWCLCARVCVCERKRENDKNRVSVFVCICKFQMHVCVLCRSLFPGGNQCMLQGDEEKEG
jgi:hypothetical protein